MKHFLLLAIILLSNIAKGQNNDQVYINYNDDNTYIILNRPDKQIIIAHSAIINSSDIKSDCFLSKKKNGTQ